MVSCPSRFSLDLSHCAKPNLPGTKMVGRKLWRKRISPLTSSGCAGEPNSPVVSVASATERFTFLRIRAVAYTVRRPAVAFPKDIFNK